MISFFRKIRQKLLTDLPAGKAGNRVTRYLAYAIGEILLVVIGILIALQVNNWNESRKMKINEQAYLLSLKEDLQEDIAFNKRNVLSRFEKKVEALKIGKAYYQGNYQFQDTVLFLNTLGYGGVFGRVVWAFKKNTYNQLLNTGQFKEIENDSLRAVIIDYYNLLNTLEESGENKETGYIKYTNSLRPFNREDTVNISEFDQKLFLSKVKTEEFYMLLNLELNLAYDIKNKCLVVNERAEKLIKLIEIQTDK